MNTHSLFKIWLYFFISRVFGLTFGIKLMEKREEKALHTYKEISGIIPQTEKVIKDEDKIVIYIFNYYISISRNLPLKKRFLEMALISLSITALTFGIGYMARTLFHIEI